MTNEQYGSESKFFSPLPQTTGAPGTPGESAHPPMADTAFTVAATGPYESVQNRPASDYSVGVGRDDTATPGALYEGISGEGPSMTASTGAGQGSAQMSHPNSMSRPR